MLRTLSIWDALWQQHGRNFVQAPEIGGYLGKTPIDQTEISGYRNDAMLPPATIVDNGRREKPTTQSWDSWVIGPGSNFQIVNPSPCRPTRRAEIPSRERETVKNDRV